MLGGYAYKRLSLPFSSPLINIYWDRDEYVKFIEDPLFYLNTELVMVNEGDLRKGIFPIGQLGDSERSVKMKFVHTISFKCAKQDWDRRKVRINRNNLFVKMGFDMKEENSKLYIKRYEEITCNKILVCFDESGKCAFKTERFIWESKSRERVETFCYNDYFRGFFPYDIDLLKLLTGNKSYSRY